MKMTDYFEEMGWTPLGEGETPNHGLHLARLLRDSGMWDELEWLRTMQHGERPPPPASRDCVQSLPEKVVTESGKQCPVCLKEFELGETTKVLPCKHAFHPSCILPWLEKTNSCPVCRHELATDDEEYEAMKKHKQQVKQREAAISDLHNSMFS
ncbi:hypothetical protein B566_EDAN014058 [Ephemera danica]|nr:hypothetical protein B566_EDAN014058 [Ephemera danica]